MLLEHQRNYGLGMDALTGYRMLLEHVRSYGLGHECTGNRMLLEHLRNYGLGIDALLIELTRTLMELWFGHGCSANRTH